MPVTTSIIGIIISQMIETFQSDPSDLDLASSMEK